MTWRAGFGRAVLAGMLAGASLSGAWAQSDESESKTSALGSKLTPMPHARAQASVHDRTGPAGGEQVLAFGADPAKVEIGRRIYREGVGANGQPIRGLRFGGIEASGKDVACVSCHRRSGLGSVEGTEIVAPVSGRFLFQDAQQAVVSMNIRTNRSFNQRHAALDDAAFAAAMNEGRHIEGRELSLLMPRFEFNATELAGLKAYLSTLSTTWSTGVEARRLRLATVVTPDVSAARRATFIETIRAAVTQKNGNFMPGMRTMSSAAEMLFRSDRHWDLDVWELTGTPDTWAAQLAARQRANPVFALVSGLGGGEWGPVHRFCESAAVPCWFPSVDSPPVGAERDFYSLYFSKGVRLEAEVLARHLVGQSAAPRGLADAPAMVPVMAPADGAAQAAPLRLAATARVIQLHRGDAAGRAGAQRLQEVMASLRPGLTVLTREVAPGDAQALQAALATAGADDALMLWWPADALGELATARAPESARVFASTRLAGDQVAAVPASWVARWQLVDGMQLPEARQGSLFYFNAWMKVRQMPVRDEVMQSEVYFALSYFAETLTDMIDNVHRDYLIERAESMLSLREGQRSEDEAREQQGVRYQKGPGGTQGALARMAAQPEVTKIGRPIPGRPLADTAKREGTTVYPRLGLGQGQRMAAKSGRIVRVELAGTQAETAARSLVPVTDWIVP